MVGFDLWYRYMYMCRTFSLLYFAFKIIINYDKQNIRHICE